jgi:hypothetical protein
MAKGYGRDVLPQLRRRIWTGNLSCYLLLAMAFGALVGSAVGSAHDFELRDGVPIIGGLTMSKNISRLPRGKKQISIDIVRTRLRNHVELVLASNNEVLIRMIERFFSEMIDQIVRGPTERPKAPVVPIRPKEQED